MTMTQTPEEYQKAKKFAAAKRCEDRAKELAAARKRGDWAAAADITGEDIGRD